jgi:hypothetical protein
MTTAPDIFLSYSREDQARARLFAEAFAAQGFSVWWHTELKSGEAYDEVTENALRTAIRAWRKRALAAVREPSYGSLESISTNRMRQGCVP